jgi:NADPH-dependent 2,4-dienoyl-CoA reductase/sulfur reductase-like enzyme
LISENTIIVIGGNAAGPAAAAKAKRQNPDANVIMFEAGEFISTGTCELPYLLKGDIKDYQDIVFFTPESFYKDKGVKVYTKHFVESIDRKNKTVTVKNLTDNSVIEFQYSKLILATGSKAKKIPQLSSEQSNLFFLKSVSDYLKIKSYFETSKINDVLIIGAGYIGLETAEAFKSLGANVTVLEKENLPFAGMDAEIRHLVLETLTKNGIEFIGGNNNAVYNFGDKKIKNVKIDGRIKEFDLYLSSVGVEPNNSLAIASRLDIGKSGGIKVDNKMRTSDFNIYAAGDNVEITNKITRRSDYIPLATIAHSQGHTAGANAAGANLRTEPVIQNLAVKIFDRSICKVGLSTEEAAAHQFNFKSVHAVIPNLVHVMPNSQKVFGKIIYESDSKLILGASFIGGKEVIGYADIIAMMINNKIKAEVLAAINYNYTPPLSPFVNLLSVLGRKIN